MIQNVMKIVVIVMILRAKYDFNKQASFLVLHMYHLLLLSHGGLTPPLTIICHFIKLCLQFHIRGFTFEW